jgi:hypothetical protein
VIYNRGWLVFKINCLWKVQKRLKKRKVEPFYNFVRWAWSYARQVMHPKTRNGQPGECLDGLDKYLGV